MQNNNLNKKNISTVAVALLLGANLAIGGQVSPVEIAKKELRSVPTAEMAAKAASIVAEAKAEFAEHTAEAVVDAAFQVKSAAIVSVVSSISRQNNELAPAAAAKAAALRSKDAAIIARAAAGVAPAQAAKIAAAVCKAVPAQYSKIATAVAQAVPSANQEILAAVVSALPSLQPFVEQASSLQKNASVGVIMASVQKSVGETASKAGVSADSIVNSRTVAFAPLPAPTVGAPFTPYSGSPNQVDHDDTVEVPAGGGRNYFGP